MGASLQIRKSFGVRRRHPTRLPYGLALLLILAFPSPALAQTTTGVCDRTAQVRDAIVVASASRDCNEVTDARLAAITRLSLSSRGITTLQAGDFAGLSALYGLSLYDNRLTTLPVNVFAGLSALTVLILSNALSELPEGVFADLRALTRLDLRYNALSELPEGVFADLSELTELWLSSNALTELPAGLFEGVSKLTRLDLRDNPGAPFELVVGLTRTDAAVSAPGPATVVMMAPLGAPFPLTANLTVANGDLSSHSLTLAAGRVIGRNPVMVTALSNGTTRLTFEAPQLPCGGNCFDGLVPMARPLTLFTESPTVLPIPDTRLPAGDSAHLILADYFTLSAGKSLSYTAIPSDPSLATVRITAGVLTITANDSEEEGTLTVTVTATDRDGASTSTIITVVIEAATGTGDGLLRGWRLPWLMDRLAGQP